MCRRRPLFYFFIFVFSPVFSFLVGLFISTRDRRAHFRRRRKRRRGSSSSSTPRAQRKNQGFPQTRDHISHALEEEEEEDFESTLLSWCLFSSLINYSFEREGIGGTVRSKACDDTKCGRRRLLLEKSRKKTTKARKETTLFLITARRRWTSTQKTTKRRRRRRKRFLRACWLPRN